MVQKKGFPELFICRNACAMALMAVMTVCFLNCCATIPKQEDPKALLRSAAAEYWKLRMQDKYEDTYKMEDREGLPPFESYRMKVMLIRKFNISSHSIKDVNVTGDKGTVQIQVDVMLPRIPKALPHVLYDAWVYRNGQWRHVPPAPEVGQ
jgi:hypothetical protein